MKPKEPEKRVIFICPKCQKISTTVHEVWKSIFVDDCGGLDKFGDIERVSACGSDSSSTFQHTLFDSCNHRTVNSSKNCAIIISKNSSWNPYKEFSLTSLSKSKIAIAIKKFLKDEKINAKGEKNKG